MHIVQQQRNKMPKIVTASEAKLNLGALFQWAENNEDAVVIKHRGEPTHVLMTYANFEELEKLKEQARREAILQEWRQLANQVRAENQDLTPAQADQVADDIVRETVDRMVEQGKIKFQEA